MRPIFILCIMISMLASVSSQKQLDSIYLNFLQNNEWQNNIRRTYQYGENTKAEIFSSYTSNVQNFVPAYYYFYTYSPTCNNYLIQRDNYTYTNGVLGKNNSTYYELNSNCHLEQQKVIRFDGVTTVKTEYLDIDANGNAAHIEYYSLNTNNMLALSFEDFITNSYGINNKLISMITNRRTNGVNTPWSKQEYTYTNNGKVENYLYYFYDEVTSQFVKSLEDRIEYKPLLEVHSKYTYNNPTSTAQILWIDSTFFDSDMDIIQIKTMSNIFSGSPSYSKADYYYTKKIDEDKDGFDIKIDCNDKNPLVNPNAVEICDALDNNCDGKIDEGLQIFTYYLDNDGDGYGVSANALTTCQPNAPTGYTNKDLDCDDSVASINPATVEVCDNLDNNCNGMIDDGLQIFTYYLDNDGDGYGVSANALTTCQPNAPTGYTNKDLDCDDSVASINPATVEVCDNLDNNCNGMIDDGLQIFTYYLDNDGDGYGVSANALTTCQPIAPTGYTNKDLDCDDSVASINPATAEVCDNLDNNCNGMIDDGLQIFTYYIDNDGDGYGVSTNALTTCQPNAPAGYTNKDLDCDDTNVLINPAATDIENNGIDEDCNGIDLVTWTNDVNVDPFILYPNPVLSILHIKNINNNNFTLKLKTLSSINAMTYQNPTSIDLSTFQNGIYILQFITDEGRKSQYRKILIHH